MRLEQKQEQNIQVVQNDKWNEKTISGYEPQGFSNSG